MRRSSLLFASLVFVIGGSSAAVAQPPLPAAELAPLAAAGEEERYTVDTLWEKIDGEAELFRPFGLREARFSRFEDPADSDRGVEIATFEFPSSLSAFGVYASYLPAGEQEQPLGNGAFSDDYQGLLWHGTRFVLVDAFGEEKFRQTILPRVLHAVSKTLGAPPAAPPIIGEFAKAAAATEIRYRPRHLLGREAMPPGLEGTGPGGKRFFLATVPAEGKGLLERYGGALEGPSTESRGGTAILTGTDPALGPVTVAVRDGRLAGARAAADPAVMEVVDRLLLLAHP